ncbi:MAG: sugar MFS transporter [Verrucomicrobium sp.]|nr:sugar MFS transporter [Verrucomicrobium sp.]
MVAIPTAGGPAPQAPPMSAAARRTGLIVVTALFFMWGFITCLNDILVPHLKAVFDLNYVRASLIQFCFFGAYFIMSFPAGWLVSRWGYQTGMVTGLLTCGTGTILFIPAADFLSYAFFLAALFVLATGVTLLQVAANPYVSVLGAPETASSRLNLAQAFNSLGTTIAPFLGGWLILSHVNGTGALAQAAAVKGPYLLLSTLLLLLAGVIHQVKLPHLRGVEENAGHQETFAHALKVPHLVLGAVGIFLYVGAEVSIGSYLINFMGEPGVAGFTPERAAGYVGYYWMGAMIGRFIGSALTQRIGAGSLLAFNAAAAALLCAAGMLGAGHAAMWAVLAIGLFNSVMFPNIFTLGIARLGRLTGHGSSLLIMAIVGGALVPVAMGHAADLLGVQHSLFIPALCYLYIIYYGLSGCRKK